MARARPPVIRREALSRGWAMAALCAGLLLTGCAEQVTTRAGVTAWLISGERQVVADATPLPENEVYSAGQRRARVTAAINETVGLQLVARTQGAAPAALTVHVSDLSGAAGTLPAATSITLFRVQFVQVEQFRAWYPLHAGRSATPLLVADLLTPWEAPKMGGPLRLTPARCEAVWLDIRIPPATAPGEYAGRLELRSGEQVVFSTTLQVRVLPLALPTERELPVVCRVDPRDLLSEALRWPRDSAEETRILMDVAAHAPAVRLVDSAMSTLHAHRVIPVLWANFPKYRPADDRTVEVVWDEYDALAQRWLDGAAFADRAGVQRWIYPLSVHYPDAERNGGLASAGYARLLNSFYAACRAHFQERGWEQRALLRPVPPERLTQQRADDMRRLAGIFRQSDPSAPLISHLPAQSPRTLGWHNAPAVEPPAMGMLAPPAMLYEPAAMRSAQAVGRGAWFLPDEPPYCPSLRIEAPAADPRALAWQAYRYGCDGIWIEHAADDLRLRQSAALVATGESLVYPGSLVGLPERVLPSIRLKRLRSGLQDYALLRLMERSGRQLLAQTIAQRVVRYGFTDACGDNLLSVHAAGWSTDPTVYGLARDLLLQELVNEFEPSEQGRTQQLANLAGWGRVLQQSALLQTSCRGVRLAPAGSELRASAFVAGMNRTDRTVSGAWAIPVPPFGARPIAPAAMSLPPGAQRSESLQMELAGLAFNTDGIYTFDARFDTEALGAFVVPCRLAVTAAPTVREPPVIDGDLGDWAVTTSNSAGDFRLVRGGVQTVGQAGEVADATRPELSTQAHCCVAGDRIHFAVRCALRPGEPPRWLGDNVVPVDGAIPWGQDVVEILLSPSNIAEGSSGDIFCLQVKPSGLLVSRKGCLTQPPIGPSEEWRSGALVASRIDNDAWAVELSLPLSALGSAATQNRIWGLNVTRLDAARGEYSSWSGARGHCYAPQRLGNLILQNR